MVISLDPVLVTLGPLAVRWFGLLALVGLGGGIWLTLSSMGRQGLDQQAALRALSWAIPIGVVCARLVHLIGWWDYYLTRPSDVWQLPVNGLSLWGGLVGGGLAAAIALRHDPTLRRRLFDTAAPSIALAIGLGRLGAFVDGFGQGLPSDVPWATTYASPMSSTPDFGVPRHPVQVYDALVCLGLCVLVYRLPIGWRGSVFGLGYAAARLLLGGVRVDPPFLFGVQIEQILAAVAAAGIASLAVRCVLRARPVFGPPRPAAQRTDSLAA